MGYLRVLNIWGCNGKLNKDVSVMLHEACSYTLVAFNGKNINYTWATYLDFSFQ